MTRTLTTERLKALLDELKSWQYGYDPVDDKEQFDMLATAEWAVIELLANREAQPVACDIERIKRHALPAGECPRQSRVVLLSSLQRLLTAPPAPARAQAVAWEMRYWNSGHNCWHDWERITAEQHAEMSVQHATSNDYEFRVLYDAPSAPSAPAVLPGYRFQPISEYDAMCEYVRNAPPSAAVPDALANDIDSDDHPLLWSYNNGWNACRAAMLAQPVSGGYTLNSPEIPDGWVACSEQMPDDEQECLVQTHSGFRYVSFYDEHSGLFYDMRGGNQVDCVEHILVTHWMPLPAAPEVSRDDA